MLIHLQDQLCYIPDDDDDEVEVELESDNLKAPVLILPSTYRLGSDEEIHALYVKLLSSDDYDSSDDDWSIEYRGCGGRSSYVSYLIALITYEEEDELYRMYIRKYRVDNGSCYSPYDGYDCAKITLDIATLGTEVDLEDNIELFNEIMNLTREEAS